MLRIISIMRHRGSDYRDAIPFRKTSRQSKISQSFLMSNNDFKFNETIGTNLRKNLNIQRIVINEYQQEQRAFNGSLLDNLFELIQTSMGAVGLRYGCFGNR